MSHVRIACNSKGTWRQRGWTGWWVWRLAGGKATGAGWWVGPLSNGEPFGAPPLKPLSSGERLRGSSLGPCPTRSALEPTRSAPEEGGGGERLGGLLARPHGYFQAQNHQKYTCFPLKTLSLQRGPSEGLSAYRLKPDISCHFWGKTFIFLVNVARVQEKSAHVPQRCVFLGPKCPKIHIFPIETSFFPHVPTMASHTVTRRGSFQISLKNPT